MTTDKLPKNADRDTSQSRDEGLKKGIQTKGGLDGLEQRSIKSELRSITGGGAPTDPPSTKRVNEVDSKQQG